MKTFLFVLVAALTAAQQFQQTKDFTPSVRLAGTGFFQGSGTFTSSSSGDTSNQFQSRTDSQSSSALDNKGFQSNSFQEVSGFQTGSGFQGSSFQGDNDFQNVRAFQRTSFPGDIDNQRSSFQSGSGSQNNAFKGISDSQTSSFQRGSDLQLNSFQSGTAFVENNDFQSSSAFQTNRGATAQSGSSLGSTFQSGNSQVNQNRFQSGSFQLQNQNNFQQQNQNSFQSGAFQQSSTSGSQSQGFSHGSQFQQSGVFEPLNLPSGASALLGSISTSFTCVGRPYGYYADQDNFCRVFHVCNPALFSDGAVQTYQYSFMCGEGTVFDQKEMTCVVESAATPCQEASNYYIRNQEFGLPQEKPF